MVCCAFLRDATGFLSPTIKALNIPLHGRVKCEGTEGGIVVAHDRLPSPAHMREELNYIDTFFPKSNRQLIRKIKRCMPIILANSPVLC